MAHRPTLVRASFVLAGLGLAACNGGANTGNAAPRISEVPQQSTTGGTTFSLDLADYATDREGATLTWSVTSGGGSFASSTYSNTFDTMGDYDVEFTVTDGRKTTNGTFRVRVTSANLAVVREDQSGLLALDTATEKFLRISGASATPSLATTLSDGRIVYQVAAGTGTQLWVFDPFARSNTRIAATATGDVTYRAKTSDDKLLYTTGTGNSQRLYYFNPTTGLSRDVAQDMLSTLTVLVNTDDIVFYEVGTNGQADVYGYDPSEDEVFEVSAEATDEQLQAVLPNGGVVFTRVGGGGERDLFCYRIATGLVEIGSDVTAIATDDKNYKAFGSSSQVVFEAQSGSVSDLYSWNPSSGQTTSISAEFTAGAYDLFAAIGAGNEVVFNRVVSGSEADAYFYDLDSGVSGTVRNSTDLSEVLNVVDGGSTRWAILRGSGTLTDLIAVSLIATPATQTFAGASQSVVFGTLTNGDVVGGYSTGTALVVFDASAGTWGTPITGTGMAFGGNGLDAGDFVYSATVSSQTDLSMWDASATTSVTISDVAGDDTFAANTADATILFTRVTSGNTNTDLFVWDGTDVRQLTDEDAAGLRHDHAVLGQVSGSR